MQTSSRKSDHLRINLEEDVSSSRTTGLENLHFIHQALPEIDLDALDLTQTLFGKQLRTPILVSSMTGGTPEAAAINRTLAQAAQETGIALGLGSQRAAIEDPTQAYSFQVRQYAPDILLFANLGAIQLNYGYSLDQCRKAVEIAGADGLILHLNPLQEALQPEGDTRFGGLLQKIEAVCRGLDAPVIVKEVGWGISYETARKLASAGVAAIDVAGAGGTSWSQVEMFRSDDDVHRKVAAAFRDWGIPTADSIRLVTKAAPHIPIIGSGGIRNGVEIAKCIALGASLGGLAGPFLKAASVSREAAVELVGELRDELRVAMFACGAANLSQLKETPLLDISPNPDRE
ncbi:MAG: type 2 isopentenyl-diphosphate Delta-isomerase [Chloroflexi bacterium]|nr:type 2 isopentenyl-diphosphate Delta-isomerase [Chloroflexota bacterium]